MKLDTTHMRYLSSDDFKVLSAVEQGSRNHEVVPIKLIHQFSGLRSQSSTQRSINELRKIKLIKKLRNASYDGLTLSYLGHDYLAFKNFVNKKILYSIGTQIGIGKESDIYSIINENGQHFVLKIHRLGRISFRTVKNNRDYLSKKATNKGKNKNWMYLSTLASEKEYFFMKILYENGFNVPIPIDYSRHCIIMERINGFPLRQLKKHENYKKLYSDLMKFILNLGQFGLIHCDFNEFNIMLRDETIEENNGKSSFVIIDFPQCISIDHIDAERYFKRDVDCIRLFFEKKFNYKPKNDNKNSIYIDTDGYGDGFKNGYPVFKDIKRIGNLDTQVEASGFNKKKAKEFESAIQKSREIGEFGKDVDEEEKQLAEIEKENENEEDESEEEEEEEEIESNESDDEYESEKEDQLKEENEKIIEILSSGVKELKMDKLGNYILE